MRHKYGMKLVHDDYDFLKVIRHDTTTIQHIKQV